nr:unnamed protein product [Callosobruchus chinensis]
MACNRSAKLWKAVVSAIYTLYEKTNETEDYFHCGDAMEILSKNYGDNDIFYQLKYAKRETGFDRNQNFRKARSIQDMNQNSSVKISGSGSMIKINAKFTLQRIEYSSTLNQLVISDKADLSETADTQQKNKSNVAFATSSVKQLHCSTKFANEKFEDMMNSLGKLKQTSAEANLEEAYDFTVKLHRQCQIRTLVTVRVTIC